MAYIRQWRDTKRKNKSLFYRGLVWYHCDTGQNSLPEKRELGWLRAIKDIIWFYTPKWAIDPAGKHHKSAVHGSVTD